MDTASWATAITFGVLVLLSLVYAVLRLLTAPKPELDDRSVRIARALGQPKFLDALLAKPMTSREKLGWLLWLVVCIGAVAFTYVTGAGVRA